MAEPALNRRLTSTLIALYREHECLWNSDLAKYKEQLARELAFQSIQKRFEDDTGIWLDIKTIKIKLQSFRSTVSREMKKIAADRQTLQGSGEQPYVPCHAHWTELKFLCRVIRKRQAFAVDVEVPDYDLGGDPAQWKQELDSDEWCPDPSSLLSSSLPGSAWPASQSQSQSPSSSTPGRKRRRDTGDESSASPYPATEDRDMIWAKNLVEDLNQVEGEKNRLLLKIKINRLVQDALVQQIQGGAVNLP